MIDARQPGRLAAYLVPDAAQRFRRRAWVAKLGELRLSPDGPVVASGPGATTEEIELVVVEEGARVGAVLEESGFQQLIYVDPADLADVVTREVKLAAEFDRAPAADDVGVTLHIGARPEVLERRNSMVRVSGSCEGFEYEGWMPGDALGRVFDGQEERGAESDAFLASDGELFVAPGGARLARFYSELYETREFEHDVRRLGRPLRGFQKVEHQSWFCTVRGWARLADVAREGEGNDVWGGLTSPPTCDPKAGTVLLPAGVWLRHAGSQVVFATSAHSLWLARVVGSADERLCLSTPWGPLEVQPLLTL
ncbi:hypothetical protein [Nannocystis punicea]|uniref:Uncharacterized protein n=1 Tax=Nannocystis punicea TaxID=2995304 RepID=A0ABY7H4V6_9BACT|nr:hypothetical protein [Nannocystis poenicansa]WAS94142.1 hypothetical protein O0S08_49095 [Nannocystis poenicansa]